MNRYRPTLDPAQQRREGGYAIILSVFLVIPMFVATGLSVDVGAWYVHANRMQAAADAGALAGVVHMPDFTRARAAAIAEVERNDFLATEATITVTRGGNERLRVTVSDTDAPLFFTRLIQDEIEITRSSVAEYIKPIPLGSPSNVFGNSKANPDGADPHFWAAVNGINTAYEQGDPYQVQCVTTPEHLGTLADCDGGIPANQQYRPEGYYFAVDVPLSQVGNLIHLWVFDPSFIDRGSFLVETGDHVYDIEPGGVRQLNTPGPKPGIRWTVRDQDGTPLDYTDNPVHPSCGGGLSNPTTMLAETNLTYKNQWVRFCSFTPTNEGIYPLQVQTSGHASLPEQGDGTSSFSVAATIAACGGALLPPVPCEHPRVYAIGEMSLLINSAGGVSEFFLGQIDERRAGETFLFRSFDPGDGNGLGDYRMTIEPPPGYSLSTCDWEAIDETDPDNPVVVGSGTAAGCTITTKDASGSLFNGLWMQVEIPVPTPYPCRPSNGDDCWWTVHYDVPGAPQDRVTFEVFSARDPVHLVG